MLMDGIKMLFGNNIYKAGKLDRSKIASVAFSKPEILTELNKLVHPVVIRYGKQWMDSQKAPYVIKEAAIFFESGSYTDMDIIVGVYAPQQLRMQRTMERDNISQEKVQERMAQQMDEDEKMKRCDHVIINDDKQAILPQVLKLHELFLEKASRQG